MPVANLEEIKSRVGSAIGASTWIEIGQRDIDTFAEVTGDHQFIHVDADAAAKTPFGGTIAHGFLTLSLLSQMAAGVLLFLVGAAYRFARKREGMGAGDPKLLAAIALWLGPELTVYTLLGGALIGLAPRSLYAMMAMHPATHGLDALEDQQLGGVVMLMVGATSYFIGGLAMLGGLLKTRSATA